MFYFNYENGDIILQKGHMLLSWMTCKSFRRNGYKGSWFWELDITNNWFYIRFFGIEFSYSKKVK